MIVLDSNVISELMKPAPDPGVAAWIDGRPRALLYTTTINQAEILHGIAAMPAGRRRSGLADVARAIFEDDFPGRILPFGAGAAACYPGIVLTRRRAGKPIEGFDALIAAIALAAGASVATPDVGAFEGCGLTIINPWTV